MGPGSPQHRYGPQDMLIPGGAVGSAVPHVFTSDLSIDEILLVEEAGFEPVELVLGSAYFNVGWQNAPWCAICWR